MRPYKSRKRRSVCITGNWSHWYTYQGRVGSSSPVCVRAGCGAPNPHYDPDRDPYREEGAGNARP